MRLSKAFVPTALSMTSCARAAVVAVEAGQASPTAFELEARAAQKVDTTLIWHATVDFCGTPGSFCGVGEASTEEAAVPFARDEDTTSTTTTTTTSTVYEKSTVITIPSTPISEVQPALTTAFGAARKQQVPSNEVNSTVTIASTTIVTVIAQPIVTVYVTAAIAERKSDDSSNAPRIGTMTNAGIAKADSLARPQNIERGLNTKYAIVTQLMTSTVPETQTTVIVQVTSSPPPQATDISFTTLSTVLLSETNQSASIRTVPTPTTEVTVVTDVITMTVSSSHSAAAASPVITLTSPFNTNITEVRYSTGSVHSNNTSVDTQSYLDISTFSMTSIVSRTPETVFSTVRSTKVVPAGTSSTGATRTDDTMGYTGAVTSTMGSDSGKMAEVGSFYFPTAMVVAMAVCFGLALLL
ncbi:hypothetical protein LTR37_001337 [Vermiconidia calcicola]|uniref:Uncharacterized protein n=1 Tax=Vermiconidia calcicola TaxID=1690605 RepID=A0ACC3NW37_9PEZI|nr:hypothetical protein LTR37_001337 [Vermiconidia calcicola]